jgi:hypothetical protein
MKRDANKDARQRTGSKLKRVAIEKPAGEDDQKPAHAEGPDDEFSKLEQQYDSASIEERDRLHPEFIQAIRTRYPGLEEETWRALRGDDSLKATLRYSMKRLLDRHDLSVGRKTNAREDSDAAMGLLGELLREDLEPEEMRGHARELATRTLFIGLRTRLSPEEVDAFQARFMADRQRKLGEEPKEEKPGVAHAKELACEIAKENSELSSIVIAEEIPNRWRLKKVACPKPDWLVRLVRKWRRIGGVPPQTNPRRRRTYPLRRASPKTKFSKL